MAKRGTKELREKLRNAHLGKNLSLETRQKMSEIHKNLGSVSRLPSAKGRVVSNVTRAKLSNALKGKVKSSEHLRKIGLGNRGKVVPAEVRVRIGNAHRGEKSFLWKGGVSKVKGYRSFMERRREIMKKCNGGTHSIREWETLKAQYNWTCRGCLKIEPDIKLTEDHIIPISKGGSDNIENIQPLCRSCNSQKSTKIIKYNI